MSTKHAIGKVIFDLAKGRFISITFRKKDGTIRTLTCQPSAVKTHLSPSPSPSHVKAAETRKKNHPNLLPVYDVHSRSIKSINLDTILSVKIDGHELRFAS